MGFKIHRVAAIVQRQLYLYQRSIPRLAEVFFWPLLDLFVWGFVTLYLRNFPIPKVVSFFLGALILWDILFRAQQGISVSFLEEIWAKNLPNLFVSPLRPAEFLAGLMLISVVKVLLAGFVGALLAWLFYSYDLSRLGLALIPFVLNLMIMGWSIGIVTMSTILRFGQEAEMMAWGLAFLVQPFSAVFYPVSVLPAWIQPISLLMPSSHVFEGMRQVIETGQVEAHRLLMATGLNALYFSLAVALFYHNLRVARDKGLLIRSGIE
jgi:ABC-2 type transport system permease protein